MRFSKIVAWVSWVALRDVEGVCVFDEYEEDDESMDSLIEV